MPTNKEIFYSKMNALADTIISKAGLMGKQTIDGLTYSASGLGNGLMCGTVPPVTGIGRDGNVYLEYNLTPRPFIELKSGIVDYINTEYTPTLDTKVEIECNVSGGSSYPSICGARNAASTSASAGALLTLFDGPNFDVAFGTGLIVIPNLRVTDILNKDIKFSLENGYAAVTEGENVYDVTFTPGTYQCNYPLYLFTFNQAGSPYSTGYVNMKVYDAKIYENNVLARHFIPYDIGDGVWGLYDKVTETILASYYSRITGLGGDFVINAYIKLDGFWQQIIGSDIYDIFPDLNNV